MEHKRYVVTNFLKFMVEKATKTEKGDEIVERDFSDSDTYSKSEKSTKTKDNLEEVSARQPKHKTKTKHDLDAEDDSVSAGEPGKKTKTKHDLDAEDDSASIGELQKKLKSLNEEYETILYGRKRK
jgi:hypothetical protein